MVIALWDRLTKLQEILRYTPTITYLEILKQLNPPLGYLYQMVFEIHTEKHQARERFEWFCSNQWQTLSTIKGVQRAIDLLKEQQKAIEENTGNKFTTRNALDLLTELSKEFTFRTDILKELYTGCGKRFMLLQSKTLQEKIVNNLNFSSDGGYLDIEIQEKVLGYIAQAKVTFTRLTISHCSVLDDDFFTRLLQYSEGLAHLELIDCPRLTNDVFRMLNKYNKNLISLTIKQCRGLTETTWGLPDSAVITFGKQAMSIIASASSPMAALGRGVSSITAVLPSAVAACGKEITSTISALPAVVALDRRVTSTVMSLGSSEFIFNSLEKACFEDNENLKIINLQAPNLEQLKVDNNPNLGRLRVNNEEFLARDIDGRTPFLLAAANGEVEKLESLLLSHARFGLGKRALLNQVDNEYNTSLMLAIKNNQKQAVEYLLPYYYPNQNISQQKNSNDQIMPQSSSENKLASQTSGTRSTSSTSLTPSLSSNPNRAFASLFNQPQPSCAVSCAIPDTDKPSSIGSPSLRK